MIYSALDSYQHFFADLQHCRIISHSFWSLWLKMFRREFFCMCQWPRDSLSRAVLTTKVSSLKSNNVFLSAQKIWITFFLPIFQSSHSSSVRQETKHVRAALLRSFHWFPKGFKTLLLLGHPRTDTFLSWGHSGEMEGLRFDMQLSIIVLGGDRFSLEYLASGTWNCYWFMTIFDNRSGI